MVLLLLLIINPLVTSAPKTLVLDGDLLAQSARAVSAKSDPTKVKALAELVQKSEALLKKGRVYSVTQKSETPPSGDKRDYMSQGPYWWPDPAKSDGKPYIRRDGQVNPEFTDLTDHDQMRDMMGDVESLSLAYYFTKKEKYAQFATRLLRTWFLDEATKMNPHLNYGQRIPGRTEGRGIGIIDSRAMYLVIDGAILLQDSKSWSAQDHAALKSWFSDYLTWLTESPIGLDEADQHNNHGTYYDVQVVAAALFCGRDALARKQLAVAKTRLASQLAADGSQPHELSRTLSWNYTHMNLYGFMLLARLAEQVDVDLWNYETADGKGVRQAIDWLVPYAKKEKEWTYQQIKDRTYGNTSTIFELASQKYKDTDYATVARGLAPDHLTLLTN